MKSLRPGLFALGAALALVASGCRTAGVRDFARVTPLPDRSGESAAELLEEHNRNASRVQSLEARPSITVKGRLSAGVGGSLAYERPKNFKLVLSSTASFGPLADIGSNDREFWFWLKDSKEKAVFYCNYDESGSSPLASSLQPDWVVEAFGLEVVSPEEAARIKVAPGVEPGTLVLTHEAHQREGQSFVKETVVTESTRRIREHRIYSAGKKTLLARALIARYQDYTPASTDGQAAEPVFLPEKLRLEWTQEGLTLDVTLNSVKVNPTFPESRRADLFVEPKIDGFARVNLAERAGIAGASAGNRPTVRRSLPIPPPRVRLDVPSPLGRRRGLVPETDPSGLVTSDLPPLRPRGVEEVIGPQIPTISDPIPAFVHSNSGWKTRLAQGVER